MELSGEIYPFFWIIIYIFESLEVFFARYRSFLLSLLVADATRLTRGSFLVLPHQNYKDRYSITHQYDWLPVQSKRVKVSTIVDCLKRSAPLAP
jgi:hypothetical protein